MTNINHILIEIRKPISIINLFIFIFFLILGSWAYTHNGEPIEPNVFGVNINHFSAFFGGSSLLLWFIFAIPTLKCRKKNYSETQSLHCLKSFPPIYNTFCTEIFIGLAALISTVLWSHQRELIEVYYIWLKDVKKFGVHNVKPLIKYLQLDEIAGDMLGFIFFLIVNISLYYWYYNKMKQHKN